MQNLSGALGCRFFTVLAIAFATAQLVTAQTDKEARKAFERAENNYKRGQFVAAIEGFSEAIELSSYRSQSVPAQNASSLLRPGEPEIARVETISPLLAASYSNRCLAKTMINEFESAIRDCTHAIELNPRLTQALSNRGVALMRSGDPKGALPDFEKAIKLGLNDAEIYNNRGGARRLTGNTAGAMADFNRALELDPRLAQVYCNRGDLRRESGMTDAGIADLNRAIELDPKLGASYFFRGLAYSTKRDFQAALRDMTLATELDPSPGAAYGERGIIYLRLGLDAEAEKDFNECRRLQPALAESLDIRIRSVKARLATKR